ncbi:MAG: S8 family serine peptidase, partial [Planctomycetes bacterium]|nr:S8 family serine peptidase [Planctomycetota bacterium]
MLVLTRVSLSALSLMTPAFAAPQESAALHPYLEQRLEQAGPGDRLPVYFVIADRLGHEHWFPRVNRMPVDERRALVMGELKAHAARTQADLLERLRRYQDEGLVSDVSSNWIGNFVYCAATPAAVRGAALADGLQEVRYDVAWPLEQVADSVFGPPGAAAAAAAGAPANGVLATKADQVWALGFRGQGVVVMNADSGINVDHGDLAARLWTNPGEIPGNAVDDDGNGHVDDVHGWNFFDDNDDIDDAGAHGTQTAGTLVGDGTCSGTITGQAPEARVMTAALGPPTPQTGPFTPLGEVAQWRAIQYAIQMGAHVQTSSYSYKNGFIPPPNYEMHRDVGVSSLAAGLIRTNSTGNNGALAFDPTNLNRVPFNVSTPGNLPPPYLDPAQTLVGAKGGVIGVGAVDVSNGQVVSYSPRGPVAWLLDDVLAVNPSYPPANWGENHNDYPWLGGSLMGLIKPDVMGPTNTTTTTGGGVTCALFSQSGTSNATPRVAGTMALWKGANMSLDPEDIAMIVHQSANPWANQTQKENHRGAGRVDALEGLYLALCTQRVDGEPVWSLVTPAGNDVSYELDTVPDSPVSLLLGTERIATSTAGGVVGVGGQVQQVFSGSSGPLGEVAVQVSIPPSMLGGEVFSQWFTDDTQGVTGLMLSSNVIGVRCEFGATTRYCTAGTSAAGCRAILSATGVASASAPSGFVVSAATVEGDKSGQFFHGVAGRQAIPWGNGSSYRCVVPPTRRAGLMSGSGTPGACDGGFSRDLTAHWQAKPASNPGVGAVVQLQLWYRDPLNTSNRTTSFSDAI